MSGHIRTAVSNTNRQAETETESRQRDLETEGSIFSVPLSIRISAAGERCCRFALHEAWGAFFLLQRCQTGRPGGPEAGTSCRKGICHSKQVFLSFVGLLRSREFSIFFSFASCRSTLASPLDPSSLASPHLRY